jgi:Tfp pilus assembly protein PilX
MDGVWSSSYGKALVIGAVLFVVLGLLVMSLWNVVTGHSGVKAIGSGRRWAFWC